MDLKSQSDKDEFVCCTTVRLRRESLKHAKYFGADWGLIFQFVDISIMTVDLACFWCLFHFHSLCFVTIACILKCLLITANTDIDNSDSWFFTCAKWTKSDALTTHWNTIYSIDTSEWSLRNSWLMQRVLLRYSAFSRFYLV